MFWPIPLLTLVLVFLSSHLQSNLKTHYPNLSKLILDTSEDFRGQVSYEKPLASSGGFRDLTMLLFGARRLASDIAWISVLQYYGTHESEENEDHPHDFGGGKYNSLKRLVLRVIRLDPSNHYATLYGAGALAFNLNRPEEAIYLLEEGISKFPQYWKYQLYLGAILYKQKGKFESMLHLLEDAVKDPECPTLVKSILANIYRSNGNYLRSLEIWIEIYEGKESSSREKAAHQIEELKKKLGINI